MSERSEQRAAVKAIVHPYRGRIIAFAATSFAGGALEAAFLIVVTRVALAITNGKSRAGLFAARELPISTAIVLAGALVLLRLGVGAIAAYQATDLSVRAMFDNRRKLATAYLATSWATQHSEQSGRLQELLGSYAASAAGVVSTFAGAVGAALTLSALVIASLGVSPIASLVVLAALAILGSAIAPMRRRIRRRSREAQAASLAFSTSIAELGSLGLEMQVFGVNEAFAERIDRLAESDRVTRRRAGVLNGLIAPVYSTLAYGALLGGLVVAAVVGVGELSEVGAVMLVMLRSLSYSQSLQTSLAGLTAAMPIVDVFEDTVRRYEADVACNGSIAVRHAGELVAQNVGFEYPGGAEVLRGLDFRIRSGEVIGIVGPSGGGKTTLVQLLLGVRSPTTGKVLADGIDLTDVDRKTWTARVSFVPQEAQLFSGSVAENIRFFRPNIDDAMVERAARRAHLHDDVTRMEQGYASPVGERGGRLSGGQKQRVSIARALATNPELLVLDEPTSALDVQSESIVRESIAELRGSATVVVIAHRLTTLDVCDRIMVIQDGELKAFDTPEQLASGSSFYRQALELSGLT